MSQDNQLQGASDTPFIICHYYINPCHAMSVQLVRYLFLCILLHQQLWRESSKAGKLESRIKPRLTSGYYNQKFVRIQKSGPLYLSGNRTLYLYFLSKGVFTFSKYHNIWVCRITLFLNHIRFLLYDCFFFAWTAVSILVIG